MWVWAGDSEGPRHAAVRRDVWAKGVRAHSYLRVASEGEEGSREAIRGCSRVFRNPPSASGATSSWGVSGALVFVRIAHPRDGWNVRLNQITTHYLSLVNWSLRQSAESSFVESEPVGQR